MIGQLFSPFDVLCEINGKLPPKQHIAEWTFRRLLRSLELPRVSNRVVLQRENIDQIVAAAKRDGLIPDDLEVEL